MKQKAVITVPSSNRNRRKAPKTFVFHGMTELPKVQGDDMGKLAVEGEDSFIISILKSLSKELGRKELGRNAREILQQKAEITVYPSSNRNRRKAPKTFVFHGMTELPKVQGDDMSNLAVLKRLAGDDMDVISILKSLGMDLGRNASVDLVSYVRAGWDKEKVDAKIREIFQVNGYLPVHTLAGYYPYNIQNM